MFFVWLAVRNISDNDRVKVLTALKQADYVLMNKMGASMVWSPLSNLILYGQTADIAAAKASGITIGIGSDWSPSGTTSFPALCSPKKGVPSSIVSW